MPGRLRLGSIRLQLGNEQGHHLAWTKPLHTPNLSSKHSPWRTRAQPRGGDGIKGIPAGPHSPQQLHQLRIAAQVGQHPQLDLHEDWKHQGLAGQAVQSRDRCSGGPAPAARPAWRTRSRLPSASASAASVRGCMHAWIHVNAWRRPANPPLLKPHPSRQPSHQPPPACE